MRSVLIAIAGAVLLSAQVDTGAISGVIRDRSGAVVPGAEVRIVQQETNIESRLTTNDAGFYSAPVLPPGSYHLFVSKTGFRQVQSQTVDLHVQDRVEMNFDLEVGAARSEVTISAAAPLLESATSSLGQIIGERTIK